MACSCKQSSRKQPAAVKQVIRKVSPTTTRRQQTTVSRTATVTRRRAVIRRPI